MDIKVLKVFYSYIEKVVVVNQDVLKGYELSQDSNFYVESGASSLWNTKMFPVEKIKTSSDTVIGKYALYAYHGEKSDGEIGKIAQDMVDQLKNELDLEKKAFMDRYNRDYSRLNNFKFRGIN